MSRTALPTAVALVLLAAGCVGHLPEVSTDSPTSDVATTPYPDRLVPFPDGPKSRPPLPDDLTAETAADYARRHEFRYSYNDLWAGPGTEIGTSADGSCNVESTEERGDGYLVTVECVGYVNRPANDADSTASVHVDLAPWTVRYYVDADSVRRKEVP